jgi:hypothetical protein
MKSKVGMSTTMNKTTRRNQTVKTPKKSARKKTARKATASSHPNAPGSKRTSVSPEREIQREIRNKNRIEAARALSRQSGDLQGLSRAQQADSESVDELVEEGNLFEAGAVAGVEEADNADEREVRTHEVSEDDVPEEYLDKD